MAPDLAARKTRTLLATILCCLAIACGGGSNAGTAPTVPPPASPSASPSSPPSPPTPPTSAPIQHVVVVVEENHSYESVIGSAEMPYLNALAARSALATSYFANTHPSIGNYFMLTTGAIVTNDNAFGGVVSDDNLARTLTAAGKTWKVYAESLPSAGYLGGDVYPYVKHHNPFAYFSDVTADRTQANNIVPFSLFSADLTAGTLPNLAFVIPNDLNNAHDGPLLVADTWLRTNIEPLVNNAAFQQSGLLLIVFDESFASDTFHGGGHVAALLVGNRVKSGYKSATLFQHESALRLILDSLAVDHLPGAAAHAPSMAEMLP